MKFIRYFLLILLILFSVQINTFAQEETLDNELFYVNINIENDVINFQTNPINITNRLGYDNQPSFIDNNNILFTSIQNDQADIFKYNLLTNKLEQITNTKESEFSPVVMPSNNKISTVRVEENEMQRLWKFSLDGKNSELILETIHPVGYYSWINDNKVALFILGEKAKLYIVNIETGVTDIIIDNIGRSIHKIPNKDSISFVHKENEKLIIKELNILDYKIKTIIECKDNSEDYTWTSNGIVLTGKNSKIFKYNPLIDKNWKEIADFKTLKIKDITRLTTNSNNSKLIFVGSILK